MTNNYSFAEKKRIRKSFEKISSVMSLPDILEIQTDSYKHFLQEEVSPENRKEQGLENVFKSIIFGIFFGLLLFPSLDFSKSILVGFIFEKSLFPMILSNHLLFWSFIVALFSPILFIKKS